MINEAIVVRIEMEVHGMQYRRKWACSLLTALLFIAASAAAVPIEWPLSEGGNGHFYEKVQNPLHLTWVEAYWEATTRTWSGWPGHLATVAVPQEDYWVWHTVVNEAGDFWLGASKPIEIADPASGWVWITGQPPNPPDPIHRDPCLPYEAWSYTNWNDTPDQEPNNAGRDEVYLTYEDTGNGKWNDLHQASICAAYIVEYEPRNYCLIGVESATWSTVRQLYR